MVKGLKTKINLLRLFSTKKNQDFINELIEILEELNKQ